MPENVTLSDDVSVSPDGRKLVSQPHKMGYGCAISMHLNGGACRVRRVPRRLSGPPTAGTWASSSTTHSRELTQPAVHRKRWPVFPPPRPRSGTWNRHGDIVLGSWGGGSGGPLWRVSAAGGAATAVTQVDLSKGEFVHTWPTFLPDGKHFLYFRSGPPDVEGMYVGSLDVDAANQSRQRILATGVPAVFANGHLFFLRAGTLMAQPFDARRLELQGVPVPVAQDVQDHVVLHRNVFGVRRRRFRLSDRIGVWHLPAHLG